MADASAIVSLPGGTQANLCGQCRREVGRAKVAARLIQRHTSRKVRFSCSRCTDSTRAAFDAAYLPVKKKGRRG